MKTNTKKTLILVVAALVLVAVTVVGTLAFFTDSVSISNTFTVGKVAITLDEAKVNEAGVVDSAASDRVTSNEYHLVPAHSYTKDPVVHVLADSEPCWVFIKVENGISNIVTSDTNIENQITVNGWTALPDVTGVYYKDHATMSNQDTDYPVFANFTVKSDETNSTLASYSSASLNITAYAIQKDGIANVADAWTAVSGN